jgi:membrane protein
MAVYRATGEDRLSLLAAGVAFYVLFAIFPALGAATWIYGLLANPSPIRQQLDTVCEVVPAEAYGLIEGQLVALAAKTSTGISSPAFSAFSCFFIRRASLHTP